MLYASKMSSPALCCRRLYRAGPLSASQGMVSSHHCINDEDQTSRHRHRPLHQVNFVSSSTEYSKHHFSSSTNNFRRGFSTNSNVSSILSKEAATAPIDYPTSQRYLALPPAIAIHLSIGSVYVYSMWTPGMSKALGVLAAAPNDWTHSELLPVFSTAAVVLG